MCGISGLLTTRLPPDVAQSPERFLDPLSHRGPDAQDAFIDDHVLLGHTRLSILDLDPRSNQPMRSPCDRYVLVYNGEIYNYIELRETLVARGFEFRTTSDTEVLLTLLVEDGLEALHRVRGVFALALWDRKERVLRLARDRFGEKPLCYHWDGARLLFASELRALACLPGAPCALDAPALGQFLHLQYINEPHTPLAGVKKLPKGAVLEIRDPTVAPEPRLWARWRDFEDGGADLTSHEAVVEQVRAGVEESVNLMLRSDVPVAVALSAGVDSSAVAAFAARSGRAVTAVSVGYPGRPPMDERAEAVRYADELGLPVHEVEIGGESFADALPGLVTRTDDLIADVAAWGHEAAAKGAREVGAKVLLTGIGGDELFWGYGSLPEAMRRTEAQLSGSQDAWTSGGWASLAAQIEAARRAPLTPKRRWREARWRPPLGHAFYFCFRSEWLAAEMSLPDVFDGGAASAMASGAYHGFATNPRSANEAQSLIVEQLCDTWLVSNSLALGDRISMASSVEARMPLLDVALAKSVFGARRRLPDHGLGPKAWLRQALRGVLPDWVLDRPKSGFTPPVNDWVNAVIAQWGEQLLEGPLAPMLRRDAVARLIRQGARVDWERRFLLYKMIMASVWFASLQERHRDALARSP